MPYNFVADSINTKKLCSRFSSSEVQFFRPFCVFEPPLRGLEPTYDVHRRLIGKRVYALIYDDIEG